jgi:SAM-dependent methyltransferase
MYPNRRAGSRPVTTDWQEFLSDRSSHNLFSNVLYYMPSLNLIRKVASPGQRLLEAGCGSGRSAMILADMGYHVSAFDLCQSLLQSIIRASGFLRDCHVTNGDIRNLPFKEKAFQVAYSFGVLEHFDPCDIVAMLREQRRVARYVLVDIPNDRCTKQAFGDERFYDDNLWCVMLRRAGLRPLILVHRGLDRGTYVGNCSVFLSIDQDLAPGPLSSDVWSYYSQAAERTVFDFSDDPGFTTQRLGGGPCF